MINITVEKTESTILQVSSSENVASKYKFLPESWIAQDLYETIQNAQTNSEVLNKFDCIPQEKLTLTLKKYMVNFEQGLFTDMYVYMGISIKDLKPRILRTISLVSFKDKEKRRIWNLYEKFNDYDDFIEEHNANIIREIDSILLNIL